MRNLRSYVLICGSLLFKRSEEIKKSLMDNRNIKSPYCIIFPSCPLNLTDTKNPSNPIYQKMKSQFNTLPFTRRWMDNPDELEKVGTFLRKYPVLIEKDGYAVAQAEHTIIVKEDGCEVITA